MRTLMPWRTERGRYFHAHPQQAMFSLYSEHAARRVGCIGACLVSKVKDHSLPVYGSS
jgi:hypothetical protein